MTRRTQMVTSPLENFILEVLSKNAKEVLREDALRTYGTTSAELFSSTEDQIPAYYNLGDNVQIWYDGSGKPNNVTGKNNDYCIDVVNGDLYKKKFGAWERIGAMSGPQGPKGDIGPIGVAGPAGPEGPRGKAAEWFDGIGIPSNDLGQDGDHYLSIEDGDIYTKHFGRWERVGNIMGKTVNWHSGTGVPEYALGDYLDWYLDTNTANLYRKDKDKWTLVVRLSDTFRATQEFQDMVQLIALGNLNQQRESERIAQEAARVLAETGRVSEESVRVGQENARETAETNRATAETNRNTKEAERKQAETLRDEAEILRVVAEAARESAESNRITAESTRITNENLRKAQEIAREEMMDDYQDRFDAILGSSTQVEVEAARKGKEKLVNKIDEIDAGIATNKVEIELLEEEVQRLTSGGIPKLQSYSYVLTATTSAQKSFTIPLSTFDKDTDTVIVVQNRTTLNGTDYTITGKVITLTEGVNIGTEISVMVLKNVPVGADGSITGNVLAVNSMDGDRVKDGTLSYSKIKEPIGYNSLQNSTFTMGLSGWIGDLSDFYTSKGMSGTYLSGGKTPATSIKVLYQEVQCAPNTPVVFSYSCNTSTALDIVIGFWNSSNVYISGLPTITPVNTGLHGSTSIAFTTPSDTGYIRIHFRRPIGQTYGNITKLKLEYGTVATPYSNEGDVFSLGNGIQFTPTGVNGFNTSSTRVLRTGNTVTVNLEASNAGAFGRTVLFTLPVEFRPTRSIHTYPQYTVAGQPDLIQGVVPVFIQSNGDVTTYLGSGVTLSNKHIFNAFSYSLT